jgi:hypothetical protein
MEFAVAFLSHFLHYDGEVRCLAHRGLSAGKGLLSTTMSRYKHLFNGPIMLLSESPDPALAFCGRLARVVFPIAVLFPLCFSWLLAARMIPSTAHTGFFAGCPAFILLVGVIAFGSGRAVAKMSDEQRAAAMPESLVKMGRTRREHWENQAVVGGLLIAFSIFVIAMIFAGEL